MLVGVAVKVTEVPAQTVPVGSGAMETVGVTDEETAMVSELDVAVFEVRHAPPVIVITQEMTSPLARVEEEKVAEAPFCTLEPFFLKS